MLGSGLTMLVTLGVICLLAVVWSRGGWRIAWRLAVLGAAVICLQMTLFHLLPHMAGWIVAVAR